MGATYLRSLRTASPEPPSCSASPTEAFSKTLLWASAVSVSDAIEPGNRSEEDRTSCDILHHSHRRVTAIDALRTTVETGRLAKLPL